MSQRQNQQPQFERPAVYIAGECHLQEEPDHPRCDNLQCRHRVGGMRADAVSVVCHPPIFRWVGVVRDPQTGHERNADIVLCCDCAVSLVDENGQFELYIVDPALFSDCN